MTGGPDEMKGTAKSAVLDCSPLPQKIMVMPGEADHFFTVAQLGAQLLNILVQLKQQAALAVIRHHALQPKE